MNICLIPARGGSKRIKNKNIKIFFNKPFLSFAIKTAIKSKIFSKVYVSTDSIMIANIAKKNGAKIPFIRPKKIASDKSKDLEVINHFLNHAKRKKINIQESFLQNYFLWIIYRFELLRYNFLMSDIAYLNYE